LEELTVASAGLDSLYESYDRRLDILVRAEPSRVAQIVASDPEAFRVGSIELSDTPPSSDLIERGLPSGRRNTLTGLLPDSAARFDESG